MFHSRFQSKKFYWALGILLFLFLFSFFQPLFSSYSYQDINLTKTNLPPSFTFLFGTDQLGRDLLSCVALGGRITFLIALSAVSIDFLLGATIGMLAGLKGGKVDESISRFFDIFQSIPPLMFIIVWICSVGQGVVSIILGIALTGWVNTARVMRNNILQLKNMDYILVSQSMGASSYHLLFRHLLPNALPSLLMSISLAVPMAIFSEGVLSFLHLGTQPPLTSWGSMIADGVAALAYYPWRLFFPSLFISLAMIGFTLLSAAIQENFDLREQFR